MRLLVTGGAGFIGSNFIRMYLEKHADCEIVNLDKLTYAGNLENLRAVEGDPRYRFVRGDICDRAAVDDTMPGIDAVVNFAAETHVDRSIGDPEGFLKTDIFGVHVLLESARAKLQRKNLDFIVANDVSRPEIGLDADDNEVTLLARDGETREIPRASKVEIAEAILDHVFGPRGA